MNKNLFSETFRFNKLKFQRAFSFNKYSKQLPHKQNLISLRHENKENSVEAEKITQYKSRKFVFFYCMQLTYFDNIIK